MSNKIYIKCDEFTDTDNDFTNSSNTDDILNSIPNNISTVLIKPPNLIGITLGIFLMLIVYFLGKMIFYKNPLSYFKKKQIKYFNDNPPLDTSK